MNRQTLYSPPIERTLQEIDVEANDHGVNGVERLIGLKEMLDTLEELRLEEEYDDSGLLRPSEHAFATTRDLLIAAENHIRPFPYGSVFPDSEGGISVEWVGQKRRVHLNVPGQPTGRLCIYHSDGTSGQLDQPVSGVKLASWLKWLTYERPG